MEPKDKKEYELAYLVLDEANVAVVPDLVRGMGTDIKVDGGANKIQLAYPIDTNTEAYFGYCQFMLEPEKAKELENVLRMDKRVLRSLIMTPPPIKEKKRGGGEPQVKPVVQPSQPRGATLSNEALEKKIEEILQ